MKLNLKDIFNSAKGVEEVNPNSIKEGFPKIYNDIPVLDTETVYGIVSLSCAHCIELIPELTNLSHFENFVLITDGDENDNQAIIQELNLKFPIISYTKPLSQLGIIHTPTCVRVDKQGAYVASEFTKDIEQVIEFLQHSGS
ncbi:TlpA family protein disulfide reductase [Paenibacillus pabuli]|uniref:TlpA family protein disulfide reductase n=1 Tax=Paenibacillus pabuli TaxID=1472 RepID=UPI001FFF529C|nr:hypothetical protein [Paenibacillus pabuli]UPK44363.1 hypothetical protein KET34_02130 [Paenibacillus pabuli]